MATRTVNTDRYEIVVVVHTLVWDRGGQNVLLLERVNTGLFDGRLTLPGGHVQLGESISDAAVREVREEVGIELDELKPSCVLPFVGGVNFIFSSSNWRGTVRNAEPERCGGVGWFKPSQLPDSVVPWLSKALELYDSTDWFYDFSRR